MDKEHHAHNQNGGDDCKINQSLCNKILVPKLQPLLKMNKNKALQQNIDSTWDANFLQHHIKAMRETSNQTKLIEEFLPFDCSIIQTFDDGQLCTEPILKYAIVPHNYLRFEDKYFGGVHEETIVRDLIVKVQQNIKQLKTNNKQVYYVQRFKRVKAQIKIKKQIENEQKQSMMYGYKIYKITKVKRQEGDELEIQKQVTQMPLNQVIKQPLLLDYVQVNQIILKQISYAQKYKPNVDKPAYHIILIVKQVNQTKDSIMYCVKYSPSSNHELLCTCGNLDELITQMYCFDKQINTFYGQHIKQFTYQLTYYYQQEIQQMFPSHSANRLINQQSQKQGDSNNFIFCYTFKYREQVISSKSDHIQLQQRDIYNLFNILTHFHKILNIGLSDTTYTCIASNKNANNKIILFTNFTQAATITSKDQQAYDIVTLLTKILDDNYQGKYTNKLQIITETASEDDILLKFEQLVKDMQKLFL